MSNIVEGDSILNQRTHASLGSDYTNNNNRRILKSKENIFKVKCNTQLKKKLKKYKLRKNIDEDPDILDVSQNLINSLRIKSINSDGNNCYIINTDEEDKPRNYLLKMVRTKKPCKGSKKLSDIGEPIVQNSILNDEVISALVNNDCQTKKQMDAFAVMMNSRNKVIGINSPGKSKELSLDLNEVNEKKEIKMKRVLSLEKMAEAKGSLRKKEIEEYRDRFVMQKMVERAEKLKEMITSPEIHKSVSSSKSAVVNGLSLNQPNTGNIIEKKKKKTLQLCDLFNEPSSKLQDSKTYQKLAQDDIEFLNKLSPSIKKKENMLSYFNKVTKESDTSLDLSDNSPPHKNDKVIKVKFTPKRKKKMKTLKSTSIIEDLNEETENTIKSKNTNEVEENCKRRKRKRNLKNDLSKETLTPIGSENIIEPSQVDSRPKRVTKKPIKYSDDVKLFSSDEDEELHIFTPKKKKNNGKSSIKSDIENKQIENEENVGALEKRQETLTLKKAKSLKLIKKNQDNSQTNLNNKKVLKLEKSGKIINKSSLKKLEPEKKATKLAPIFMSKPQLSPAAIEAKQNFLNSGVPEKLKKHKKSQPNVVVSENILHVVHVQQNSSVCTKNYCNIFNFSQSSDIEDNVTNESECSFKTFFTNSPNNTLNVPSVKHKPNKLLRNLKNACPKFPVYRTYHLLRGKSKGEFKDCSYPDMDNSIEIIDNLNSTSNETLDKLNWCEKYKPTSSKQIIGNFESIKELKRWLETWTESLIKAKSSKFDDSDSSDFYHSDTDTRDALRNTDNLLIISGQTGSGKTSSVYAVAAELAIKVIEVNASRKRTGKIMLQDLQEATQSHKVNRGKSNLEHSQKSQEVIVTVKKRGRPKKVQDDKKFSQLSTENITQPSQSQESVCTDMSLILIDDADIVFDQDDGFCSALSQLIQSSKRPVILITSSLNCPHLQKFLPNRKILHMRSFLPRMLGTWLDIMCLADVGFCFSGLGARVLDLYKGDIRKTVNCLQFYMNSNKHNQLEEAVHSQIEVNIDDETSSMSWADSESLEDPIFCDKNSQIYIDKQVQVLTKNDTYAFNFWWSLPKYYTKVKNEITTPTPSEKMDDISNILDTLSISDVLDQKYQRKTKYNIVNKPWYSYESASVLEIDNLSNYNKSHNCIKDAKDELVKFTICKAQETLNGQNSLDISSPSMSVERQRERLVCRHRNLSSFLSSSVLLDRRATSLDYWSTCREICRLEKNKTDFTSKRNNRFFHYLKSINFLCKTELFNSLADSLS